jgi:hypothetical protein
MSRLKAIGTTQSTVEERPRSNNINLKYSQNTQSDFSIKALSLDNCLMFWLIKVLSYQRRHCDGEGSCLGTRSDEE